MLTKTCKASSNVLGETAKMTTIWIDVHVLRNQENIMWRNNMVCLVFHVTTCRPPSNYMLCSPLHYISQYHTLFSNAAILSRTDILSKLWSEDVSNSSDGILLTSVTGGDITVVDWYCKPLSWVYGWRVDVDCLMIKRQIHNKLRKLTRNNANVIWRWNIVRYIASYSVFSMTSFFKTWLKAFNRWTE